MKIHKEKVKKFSFDVLSLKNQIQKRSLNLIFTNHNCDFETVL